MNHMIDVMVNLLRAVLFRETLRKRLDGKWCGSSILRLSWKPKAQVRTDLVSTNIQTYVELGVTKPFRLNVDIIDRLLIARLDLNPQGMS